MKTVGGVGNERRIERARNLILKDTSVNIHEFQEHVVLLLPDINRCPGLPGKLVSLLFFSLFPKAM
jgi:hypothetical protein|uniref:Uncharacterized protein n=1 Tax=Leptospirillum sp. Group II '5-way CG' TaxID=419541 RepID=B6AQ38_9BACT|nr:MAG: Hypothetical protein CGL2_10965017 [Leptospirillum sp. Group II '5-way CG']